MLDEYECTMNKNQYSDQKISASIDFLIERFSRQMYANICFHICRIRNNSSDWSEYQT